MWREGTNRTNGLCFDAHGKLFGYKVPTEKFPAFREVFDKKFLQRLDAVYKHYGKPIWITEFAVADWSARQAGTNRYSEEQVMAFMKAVIPELEKRSYVERYAWFGAGRGSGSEAVRTSRLVDSQGALTPLGRLYASF